MIETEINSPRHTAEGHSCWKAADLRGLFPDEVSTDLFRRIGGAIGTTLTAGSRVLVAGDFRVSTMALKEALTSGFIGTGVDVIDAGQIPTPVAYFAADLHQPDAVLIVTASHNPADHNGLKLLIGNRPPTPQEFARVRKLSIEDDFRSGNGRQTSIAPLAAYEQFMIHRWKHLNAAALPAVVLDAGNGTWSESAPRIFSAIGFPVERISCVIDGRFPDRSSDCSRPANVVRLREHVALRPDSLGIAWDGDGDRMAVVDETGRFVSADELSMLLSHELLGSHVERHDGGHQVVVDVKLTSKVQREIESLGGIPLLERTGHAFMRARMVASGATLGLDACGHFFFGELNGADDGVFAALMLLSMMQRTRLPLSELIKQLPQTHGTPELRIPLTALCYDQAEASLLGGFPNAAVDRLDGIRMTVPDGVVLLRESGTEAVLSLRIEGIAQQQYEALLAACIGLLPAAQPYIQAQLDEHSPVASR